MYKCRQDKCCLEKCLSASWLSESGWSSEYLACLEVAEKFVVVVRYSAEIKWSTLRQYSGGGPDQIYGSALVKLNNSYM